MNTPIEPPAKEPNTPQNGATKFADAKVEQVAAASEPPTDNVIKPDQKQKDKNVFTKGLNVCGNCGTQLLGETCYQCGQPTKGLVRQFSSILRDFLDTVLNIDTRVFRTMGPLIYRPGFLTQEYFSGRRIRYVSPVRLFFFLAVLTFLLAQFSLPEDISASKDEDGIIQVNTDTENGFDKAKTLEEVEKARAQAIIELEKAKAEVGAVPMAAVVLQKARSQVNAQAEKRIDQLNEQAATGIKVAKAATVKLKESADDAGGNISFNGEVWDAKKNPIKFEWLPDSVNKWFNTLAQRAENNGKRVNKDPKVIIEALFSSLPMTLFLMLPVFALLLKIMFIFKRRLYMEHLIVALHSHAFLMLAILLLIVFHDAGAWLGSSSWLLVPLNILSTLLWIWIPIYLFLMQKRVYQQGWILTFIKYVIIGNCHVVLLSIAITFTLLVKMIWL